MQTSDSALPSSGGVKGVTIRSQDSADDDRVVQISYLCNPEYPESTVEEYRKQLATLPPGVVLERFVAESESTVVGHSWLLQKFWVEQQGSSVIGINVDPKHRSRGIGRMLTHTILEGARNHGFLRLFSEVREDEPGSREFAQAYGFSATEHVTRRSRLVVRQAHYEGYDETEERLQREGLRVATLAELGAENESVLQAVYEVDMSTARDEPSSETYNLPFDQWRTSVLEQPGMSAQTVWVALHGDRLIGLTKLRREGSNSAWHNGMGVEREYRGRGVARLLKLRTIQWSASHGIDYLYTGNDINNPRMYDINQRLGYKPLPAVIEMVADMPS